MTKDEMQKVRDALAEIIRISDRMHEAWIDGKRALATLDRELAAPEQEPFCYVNVNAQGDVTRTIKREDKWCKTPLYRHPAPQPQPVARVTGYYAGRCVIEPLDGKTVFSSGMAVYSAPVAAQSAQQPDDAKQRLLEIMRRNGLATGHGDTIDDALKELDWQLREQALQRVSAIGQDMENVVCEWTEDGDMWDGACKKVFFTHGDYEPPKKYMTFCYGCGKRIRFIEGKNNGT